MNNRMFLTATATLIVSSLVVGCGGGGSGGGGSGATAFDPPPPLPPPVAAGPLLAMGPMPQGGGFEISDVSIDTSRAQVFINDQPGTLGNLRPGHIVRVVGSTDSNGRSVADEIHFTGEITGPVDSVDLSANRLVVMGQPVTLSDDSILSTPLQNFTRGEVVQVSGFTDSNGDTMASRIDYSVSNRELRLMGAVSNLDPVNFQFSVNGLTVDYSSALSIDVPGGQLSDGLEVLITGGLSFNRVFQVMTIAHNDRDVTEHIGAQVRAEGQITAAASGEDFAVNGFPVLMGGQRDYRQGSDADIVIGAEVRVEGQVLTDGTIQVHRVWFLRD